MSAVGASSHIKESQQLLINLELLTNKPVRKSREGRGRVRRTWVEETALGERERALSMGERARTKTMGERVGAQRAWVRERAHTKTIGERERALRP